MVTNPRTENKTTLGLTYVGVFLSLLNANCSIRTEGSLSPLRPSGPLLMLFGVTC
jgi:hypothetical protein